MISCVKEIDIETPERSPKQVMSAYLQAGDSISAFMTSSLPYVDGIIIPSFDSLHEIDLYENGIFKERLKPVAKPLPVFSDTSYYLYKSTITAVAGASYELISQHPRLPIASGKDRVPGPPSLTDFAVDTAEQSISITLNNNAGTNYYVFTSSALDLNGESFNLILATDEASMQIDDGSGFLATGASGIGGLRLYFKNTQSGSKRLKFFYGPLLSTPLNDSAVFEVNRVSEAYYKHEISKVTQEPIIPVFPEPNQLFTNIENGFGIVAGAHKRELKFIR